MMIKNGVCIFLAMALVIGTSTAYSSERKSAPKVKKAKKLKAKKSSSSVNAYVTYDSYLQSNFSHPAISRKPSSVNQIAFPEPTRRAVIEQKEAEAPESEVPSQIEPVPQAPPNQ